MDQMNYDEDMHIDQSALDIEWLEQAALSIKYGRHLTNLKSVQRQLEELKKTTRSELILKVNKNAELLIGKKSPNAADIEAYYRTDPTYQGIVERLNEAIKEAEYAEIAYQQISWTRKAALENLVKLNGQQYFAGPAMPRDINKEVENRAKIQRTDEGVKRALQRTKK